MEQPLSELGGFQDLALPSTFFVALLCLSDFLMFSVISSLQVEKEDYAIIGCNSKESLNVGRNRPIIVWPSLKFLDYVLFRLLTSLALLFPVGIEFFDGAMRPDQRNKLSVPCNLLHKDR